MFIKHSVLSIDLTDKYIKILEFSGLFFRKIKRAGIIKIPDGSIVSGKIEDKKTVILNLRKLAQQTNTPPQTRVSIAIPDDQSLIKTIELQSKDKKDYESEIEKKAEEVWDRELSELEFSYILRPKKDKKDKQTALIVAVDREIIEERIRVIKQARFQIGVIDIKSLALYNMVSYNYNFTGGLDVILNIEYENSQLIFVERGEYLEAHNVDFGEKIYISNVLEHLNIEHEETKSIIESSLKFKNLLYRKYEDIVKSTHTLLLSEIATLVDERLGSKENIHKFKKVSRFYLTGDGCNTKSLIPEIAKKFKTKSYLINPFHNYSIGSHERKIQASGVGSYSTASGLANRTFSYVK